MTTKAETAVREAATVLGAVIADAQKAGLHVAWPRSPEGLSTIAVSATAKVVADEPKPVAAKK